MVAMTTATVGGERGAVLGRKPVVAVKKSPHPVGRQIVFRVEPLRGVTAAADVLRNVARSVPGERFDIMFRVTIRAGWCVPHPGRERLAMDAGGEIRGRLLVTGAARLRLPGNMQGGRRRSGWQDLMRIMTILTGGRAGIPVFQGAAVNTGAITQRLAFMALAAIHPLRGDFIVRVFLRQISVTAGAGVGLVRGGGKFGRIDEQGDFLRGRIRLRQGLVRVAFQTVPVSQTCQR